MHALFLFLVGLRFCRIFVVKANKRKKRYEMRKVQNGKKKTRYLLLPAMVHFP